MNFYNGARNDTNYTTTNLVIFRAMLTNTFTQRGDFLEIYEQDADDPHWANDVRTAHLLLNPAPAQAQLALSLTSEVARVTIAGTVSAFYRIEQTPSLSVANWTLLTNLYLPSSPYTVLVNSVANPATRFYRATGFQ